LVSSVKKIAFVFPEQFGYFPDIYEYTNILSGLGFPILFIGIENGKEPVIISNDQFKAFHFKGNIKSFPAYVSSIIKKESPEIVHVFHYRGAGILKLACQKSQAKWIIDVRTLHVGNSNGEMNALYLKNKLTHLETLVYDRVLVLTNKLKKMVSPNFRKIQTIPLAGSKKKFSMPLNDSIRKTIRKALGIEAADTVLLYAGSLTSSRKIETLVRYFAQATKNTPNVKLLIVGGDNLGGTYIEELKKIGAENVLFTGKVKYTDIQDYYYAADAGVSYLPPGTPYDYQPPTKILEYMLAGLPVFANVTPIQTEIAPHLVRGILFEDNAVEFQQKLSLLLGMIRNRRHKAILANAYQYVQDYTWESIVTKKLIPFYNSIN